MTEFTAQPETVAVNRVNRQPSNGPKTNRQPSKTEYFYRQPSNERAKINRQISQISLNDQDRLIKWGQVVLLTNNRFFTDGFYRILRLRIHVVFGEGI